MRLLGRDDEAGESGVVVAELLRAFGGPRGIRCPGCGWRPLRSSRWVCSRHCGHSWNTFDTAGCCPACRHQWTVTQCLGCHGVFRHADWYVAEGSAA